MKVIKATRSVGYYSPTAMQCKDIASGSAQVVATEI